jgi:thiamine-monophosphate kinase
VNVTERQFVERLRRKVTGAAGRARAGARLQHGIGDDCAVISSVGRNDLLVTTDFLLEGVHFRQEWQPPQSIGHKVLARGLSDIAAMGGTPRFAFLSLALPQSISLRWTDEFLAGFFGLAAKHGVVLAGGDTGASRAGVLADIMVIGDVPRGKAILRSGARPGDTIWVTGKLGGAARALDLLRGSGRNRSRDQSRDRKGAGHRRTNAAVSPLRATSHGTVARERRAGLRPLFYPQPRVDLGRTLREHGLVSAMMDLSDGLSIDLARLCEASGVGALVEEMLVPRSENVSIEQALHGGEDFELLFIAPPRKARSVPSKIGGVPLTCIGKVTSRRQLRLLRGGKEKPLEVRGIQHF